MKIERAISVFDKSKDSLIKEINVDILDLYFLKELFGNSTIDDPYNYKPFKINDFQYEKLQEIIKELKDYPLSSFELYIEAFQINN